MFFCVGLFFLYRRDHAPDDVDDRPDEAGAEDDEEGQLGVEEVLSPGALVQAEAVADAADAHHRCELGRENVVASVFIWEA